MKTFLFILLLAIQCQKISAQYYVRTKKNIGVIGMYNFSPVKTDLNLNFNTSMPFLQLGVCRQIGKYALPELGLSLAAPTSFGQNPKFIGLFSGILLRKNLFKINERKHGAKCKAELIECFITPEYRLYFNEARHQNAGQFSVRYGLGLYHVESGGSKRSRAWLTKVEVYHRNYFNGAQTLPHEFGLALRIQHFKTYDFLR
jgi:hypothetical protein